MTRAHLPRRPSIAAAALLAILACGPDLAGPDSNRPSPLAPGTPAAAREANGHGGGRRPSPVRCPVRGRVATDARIDETGGVLVFGGSRLVVPPGALDRRVHITAVMRHDGSGVVDFSPEGLRFRRPATLVLDATGCDMPATGDPAVVYLDARGDVRETIGAAYDRRWSEVAAPIMHFSGYAIAF